MLNRLWIVTVVLWLSKEAFSIERNASGKKTRKSHSSLNIKLKNEISKSPSNYFSNMRFMESKIIDEKDDDKILF